MSFFLSKSTVGLLTLVFRLACLCSLTMYYLTTRFQRKRYAPIEVVQTEKKGFGIRAADDIRKSVRLSCVSFCCQAQTLFPPFCRDDMIYEYIGEVVSQPSFMKRMREYAEEGIRHFYFMMLQKEEVRCPPSLFSSMISLPQSGRHSFAIVH